MRHHVLKNAAPPALALMGLQFGYLLGGSILVETVFNWPGSGNLHEPRDLPPRHPGAAGDDPGARLLLRRCINLLVDMLQALIDPRIRR